MRVCSFSNISRVSYNFFSFSEPNNETQIRISYVFNVNHVFPGTKALCSLTLAGLELQLQTGNLFYPIFHQISLLASPIVRMRRNSSLTHCFRFAIFLHKKMQNLKRNRLVPSNIRARNVKESKFTIFTFHTTATFSPPPLPVHH